MSKMTPPPLGVLIEIMAKKHPHPLIENQYPPPSGKKTKPRGVRRAVLARIWSLLCWDLVAFAEIWIKRAKS